MKRKSSASDTLLGQGPPQAKRRQKEGPCGTDTSPIPLAQVFKVMFIVKVSLLFSNLLVLRESELHCSDVWPFILIMMKLL